MESLNPDVLLDDRYRVISELGRGGFGVVYRGIQVNTGQTVAIKVLHINKRANDSNGQAGIERFRREMQVISKLKHPNIVRLIDTGSLPSGELYTVLEFIEGQTLAEFIEKRGALPLRDARTLMLQVLDALCCAHQLGVVHRDLKPHNVMITETGGRRNAMVLDFGIAGVVKEARGEDYKTLTEEGGLCGTPAYMAPEQIKARQITPQSDVYAWGLVFLECISGQIVIDGDSLGAIIFKQMSPDAVPLPTSLISHPLGKILARATAKDLKQRFATAQEILRPLEDCIISDLEGADLKLPNNGNMSNTGLEYKTPAALSLDQTLDSHLLPPENNPANAGKRPPWTMIAAGVATLVAIVAVVAILNDDDTPSAQASTPPTQPPPTSPQPPPDASSPPEDTSAPPTSPPTTQAATTTPATSAPATQAPEPPAKPEPPQIKTVQIPARTVKLGIDGAGAEKLVQSEKFEAKYHIDLENGFGSLEAGTWSQPALEIMSGEASWALWQGYQEQLEAVDAVCPEASLPPASSGQPYEPIVGVSPAEADAFCGLLGMRLPTAREWEAVARGPEGHIYPFAESLDESKAKALSNPPGPEPLPWNKTDAGVYNLAGGVFEWVTCDPDLNLGYCKGGFAFRGGSWQSSDRFHFLAATVTNPKHLGLQKEKSLRCTRNPQIGFRCVKK